MDRRQVCVANVRYHKPGGRKSADNLLRYLTFRESRDEAATFAPGVERWTDRGMGADGQGAYRQLHRVQQSACAAVFAGDQSAS